jgi:hypothetical protein
VRVPSEGWTTIFAPHARLHWSLSIAAAFCVFIATAQACASSRPAQPGITANGDDREDRTARALRAFVQQVKMLSAQSATMGPTAVADAMRRLADIVEMTAKRPTLAPATLRRTAERITKADALPTTEVIYGLGAALRHLVAKTPPRARRIDYHEAVRAFAAALDGLQDPAASAEQRPTRIAAALRASSDLVHLAAGADAPFGETAAGTIAGRAGPWSLEVEVAEARADVLRLGQTNWTDARAAAAQALASLADAVAAADGSGAQRERISIIRFQAERMRRTDAVALGQAEWIKIALTAALDALDAALPERREALIRWQEGARSALGSIRSGRSVTFQRAAVQDAFRTTVNVFVAASDGSEPDHER